MGINNHCDTPILINSDLLFSRFDIASPPKGWPEVKNENEANPLLRPSTMPSISILYSWQYSNTLSSMERYAVLPISEIKRILILHILTLAPPIIFQPQMIILGQLTKKKFRGILSRMEVIKKIKFIFKTPLHVPITFMQ